MKRETFFWPVFDCNSSLSLSSHIIYIPPAQFLEKLQMTLYHFAQDIYQCLSNNMDAGQGYKKAIRIKSIMCFEKELSVVQS
jgi:hypothetical protein